MKSGNDNYSRIIVTLYYLMSLLTKEGRLIFLKLPIVSFMIQLMYYISLLLLFIPFINGNTLILKKDFVIYIKKFSPLFLLYFFCELVAILFNAEYSLLYGTANITHFISIYFKYLIMISVIFLMYDIRHEKIMETIADALIINEIIIIISSLIEYGFMTTMRDMLSILTSFLYSTESVLEADGPTYCCGLVLIFYIFNKNNKLSKSKFIFLLFSLIVGRKRIAIAAFVLSVMLKFAFRNITIDKKKISIFSIIVSCGVLLYISILYNDVFFELMDKNGIELSGRALLYKYFINRSSFSIHHLPWGLGGVEMVFLNVSYKAFANNYIALALHNDMLRIYIEFGFVGFILWLIIMTYYFPKVFLKYKGSSSVREYFFCVVFCFIIYTVSNSFFYSALFSLLILVPLSTINEDNKKSQLTVEA